MKKITFFKSMRGGVYDSAIGYAYTTKNGVSVAFHGGGKRGTVWSATEITTGLSCPIGLSRTLIDAVQEMERISNSIKYCLVNNKDLTKYINDIAELKRKETNEEIK